MSVSPVLILYPHVRLVLPIGVFVLGVFTSTVYAFRFRFLNAWQINRVFFDPVFDHCNNIWRGI
jgi:hypothetical protein